MPQVFSTGWLYLFLFVMAISLVRIWFKLRTIQREAPLDRPVLRVKPIEKAPPDLEGEAGRNSLFAGPDDLIRRGRYLEALRELEGLVEELSPTEQRESRGKALFRIGACHTRLATGGDRFQRLLRAGEALRESVRLFAPARYRGQYLRALEELAGLYEDLSRARSPVQNLTQAARTCETGAASARDGGVRPQEVRFLVRAGEIYRQLARRGEPQASLRKAADSFEKAAALLGEMDNSDAPDQRLKVLKILGDTLVELGSYYRKSESLEKAVAAYDEVLGSLGGAPGVRERGLVLISLARVLLELYDTEASPAHLHRAMRHTRDALEMSRSDQEPALKGLAMSVMGDALVRYADVKDRRENLNRAVKLYETSLGIFRDGEGGAERERIRERLAETVRKVAGEEDRGQGDQ